MKTMELTKEYLDQKFEEFGQRSNEKLDKQAAELNNRMDSMTIRMDGMATKEDLRAFATKEDLKGLATKEDLKDFITKEDLKDFATKEDLSAQTRELQNYTDEVAQTIITAVDAGFEKVNRRLEKVEVKY